jgi:hypothetical protein
MVVGGARGTFAPRSFMARVARCGAVAASLRLEARASRPRAGAPLRLRCAQSRSERARGEAPAAPPVNPQKHYDFSSMGPMLEVFVEFLEVDRRAS